MRKTFLHRAQLYSGPFDGKYKMENPLALISLNTETKVFHEQQQHQQHDTCCFLQNDSNQYLFHFDIKMALEAFIEWTKTERKNEKKSGEEFEFQIVFVSKRCWSRSSRSSFSRNYTMCWLISEMEDSIFLFLYNDSRRSFTTQKKET